MDPDRDMFERRQFWPRPGRPEALGEIEFDQPCANCGFNLRGLPPGTPCPECGSRAGLNLSDEPIPWEERQTFGSFLATVYMTIFHPHELARQVWRPVRLDLRAARRFRRMCLILATPPLCVTMWVITAAVIGVDLAAWCMPFNAAAIVIWLNAATLEPMRFFRQQISYRMLPRIEVISHYASAPLLLVLVHPVLLFVTYHTAQTAPPGPLIAAGMHLMLLLATMALGTFSTGWLVYETIDVPKFTAWMYPLGPAMTSMATGVAMLIGVPFFTASMVARIVIR
jgi:hypothetical protein